MANYVPITSTEVHQGLQNAEPLFKEWAWLMYRKNSLGLPLEVIIKSGVRKTNTEALAYFAEYHKTIPMDGRVTWSDMTGKGITGALASKLSQIITNISSKGMGDPTRRYGTISHGFIRRLFAGEILRLRKKDLSFKKTPVQELPNELFDNGFDYDAVLEELNNPSSEDSRTHRNAVAKINRLLDRMEKIHNRVCEEMEMGIMTTAKESSFPKLEACLSHICRKDLEQVKGKIFEREDLINLTFMTWAKAILFYRQLEKDTQSMPLFSELFILPNQSDLGVGRLDELTIHKIDGVPPNTKQRRKLWKLGRRRYYSVGHAISTILEAFPGKHITFKVIDWKFAVGDGTRSMRIKMRDNIIETKDVKDQPLTDHKRQVERYLALSRFSYALKKQKHT